MNSFGPPDAYLVDTLMRMLVCCVAAVSALLSLGLIIYLGMVVELLRGSGAWMSTHHPSAARSIPR